MAGTAAYQSVEGDAGAKVAGRKRARYSAALLTALLCAPGIVAVDTVEQLQQRFDHEPDGVKKAKLLARLGDAQFAQERDAAKASDYTTVGLVMEKYRDNARAAFEALKKSHPDAEKHPAGFKQLEQHVGAGIREVRDVILAMPEPYRPPMQLVQKDLQQLDTELLELLFPRRPAEKKTPSPALGGAKPPEGTEKKP